jgi:archaellum component FlaC
MVWTKTNSGICESSGIKTYGLGDLLRGTICMHQLSILNGFTFIVDLRRHPISQHLITQNHAYMEYVDQNMNKINVMNIGESNKFQKIYTTSLKSADPLLICTNMFCNERLSSDCKQFMKQLLTPNERFEAYLNEKNKLHSLSSEHPHSIVHFRLGDDEFYTTIPNDFSKMNNAMNTIKKCANHYDILMTDSFRFKQFLIANNFNIKMFNTRPLHLGELSTLFADDMAESFKETLYEFFILTTASKIKTYSVYGWVSGFVKFSSLIYDVPLIDLKSVNNHKNNQTNKLMFKMN